MTHPWHTLCTLRDDVRTGQRYPDRASAPRALSGSHSVQAVFCADKRKKLNGNRHAVLCCTLREAVRIG